MRDRWAGSAIAAAIATGFLQQALQANAGYSAFVVAAARAGWVILIGAIVIFVADLGAMVVYAIVAWILAALVNINRR